MNKYVCACCFACLLSMVSALASEEICKVNLDDKLNGFDVDLSVALSESVNGIKTYNVVHYGEHENWEEAVTIDKNDKVSAREGIAHPEKFTVAVLKKEYKMKDDEQWTFKVYESRECSELEKALIYWLVFEWFYG